MKISYNWVQKYWDVGYLSPKEYRDRINRSGLTVEKETRLYAKDGHVSKDNIVWDVDVPNWRRDLQSYMWLAKENSALFGKMYYEGNIYPIMGPGYSWTKKLHSEKTELFLSLSLHSKTSKCTLISGNVINEVDLHSPVPNEIFDEVYAEGYDADNILDALEIYCVRDIASSVYFLDADKFPSRSITATEALSDGHLQYKGKIVTYRKGDVVFEAEGKIVGLAGIFFDDNVRANIDTKKLIVLGFIIDKNEIKRVIKRTGVVTYAGKMAAMGANHGDATKVVGTANAYLYKYAKANNIEAITNLINMETARKYIKVSVNEINDILDANYTFDEIDEIIHKKYVLSLNVDEDKNYFFVKLCSYDDYDYSCDIAQMIINFTNCNRIGER